MADYSERFSKYHFNLAMMLMQELTNSSPRYKSSGDRVSSARIVEIGPDYTKIAISVPQYRKDLYDVKRHGKYSGTPAQKAHYETRKVRVKKFKTGAIIKGHDNYKKDKKTGKYIKKNTQVYVPDKAYESWISKTIKQATRKYAAQVKAEVDEQ